jgi:hypothetical protein
MHDPRHWSPLLRRMSLRPLPVRLLDLVHQDNLLFVALIARFQLEILVLYTPLLGDIIVDVDTAMCELQLCGVKNRCCHKPRPVVPVADEGEL